jgi:hypothetical protein
VLEADVGASSLELALELLDTPAADITSGRHHLDDRWVLIDPVLNFAEMARYTRIKETNPILAQQDQGYRWKRGRFEPYQPTDLAPGQIVMVGYLGHWHDCQMKILLVSALRPPIFRSRTASSGRPPPPISRFRVA